MSSELTKRLYEAVQSSHDYPTCLHCSLFDKDKEFCKLAQARPPAAVIAFGCEGFAPAPPF